MGPADGKSTLVRIINGLIATDSGEVKVSGEAITPNTAQRPRCHEALSWEAACFRT